MTPAPPTLSDFDAMNAGIIASVHFDFVQIAPKKSYSMGGQDYSGMKYRGAVVRVRTEDGIEGVGEVFLTPGWYGPDTPASMPYLINTVFAPAIIGESVFNTAKILQKMDQLWRLGNNWSKALLEIAVFDAAGKTLGRPVADLLGGQVRDRFPLVGGIGTDTPEGMAKSAREYVDRGFKTIKVKIGERGNPDLDIARIREVREEVGPDIIIRTDANQVFEVREAISLIRKIERYDLDHVEQPVKDWDIEGMARIRNAIDVPLMADESVHSARDALRVIEAGAADVIKLKIAKSGGYQKCRNIIAICEAAGVGVVVGNGIQTSAASLAELSLCCASPFVHPAGEFPGPDKLTSDILVKNMEIVDGDAILPQGPGIGSDLDYDAFNACRMDWKELMR